MHPAVAQYERLRELSESLLEHARAQSWQSLARTQQEREALIASLAATDLRRLPVAAQARVREILLAVRDSDARAIEEIRPWQAQIGQLLRGLGARSPDPAA